MARQRRPPQPPRTFRQQARRTPGLLFRLARYLWGVGGKWLRIAIFVAVGTLFLILGAALTGVPALVALTALAPLVALLLVPARINPMWLLAIAAWPDRIFVDEKRRIPILREGIPLGGDELRRGVRWIFAFIAVEVGMAFYYAGVEYLAPSVDRTLVLITFALFVFLALVAASPTGKVRTRTIGVLSIVFVVLTVIFLFGGKDEFGNKLEAIGNGDARAAPAAGVSTAGRVTLTEERQYITLLGEDKLAGPVDLDPLEIGECARWQPSVKGVVIHWEDRTEESMEVDSSHPPVGLVWFKGPAEQQVGVRKTTDCN